MQFMKNARKRFLVEEIEDQDRPVFSREGLFLYTFRRKPHSIGNGSDKGVQVVDDKGVQVVDDKGVQIVVDEKQ